ncbi:SAM-dependent methyltransferase [Streptomyces beigongshangae]|uniref:SAM-dependent methyltransferase n=1 Tax=Streptomyces beigongshangae TaxID=2841597 RepID=UPI001C845398|nr:class I SAM-dependent methyltransferase [Streptomyces sp. REN17]
MQDPTHDAQAPSEAARFWENLYRGKDAVRKGNPNPVLAETAARLSPPGHALDLGCGEGGDTVWLATHGWHVTAVDIAPTALQRLTQHAARAGVTDRVSVQRNDLAEAFPTGTFDLVSAQYLQTPYDLPRADILRRAAHALAPGGLLLVVDHGSVRPWAWNTDPDTRFPRPEEIFNELALDPARFTPVRLATPEREATGPNGRTATVTDTVVTIRRT